MFVVTSEDWKALEAIHVAGSKLVVRFVTIVNLSLKRKILFDLSFFRKELASNYSGIPESVVDNWFRMFWILYGKAIFSGWKRFGFDVNRLMIFFPREAFPIVYEGYSFSFNDKERDFDSLSFSVPAKIVEIRRNDSLSTERLEILSSDSYVG